MMKKLLTVLFVCVACFCGAYPVESQISSPNGSTLVWDDALGDWRPLAGTATGSMKTAEDTDANRVTSYATATLTIGDTSQAITLPTGCLNFSFQNQGTQTVTLYPGTTAVYGSGWLVYPQGSVSVEDIPAGQTFSAIANTGATSTAFVWMEVK